MLNRILTIARYTALETVRQRVPLVLTVFAFLLSLAAIVLGELSAYQNEKLLKDFGLAAIDLTSVVIILFLGVDLISKEIQKKSLYPLLVKPLERHEFIWGRYLGLLSTLAWNLAVMSAFLMVLLLFRFGAADPRLLIAIWGTFLSGALLTAIAVLFSSTSAPILAMTLTIALLFVGRQSDILRNVGQATRAIPDHLAKAVYFALPNFQHLDFKNAVVYGDAIPADVVIMATLYVVAYAGALLGIAGFLFRTRDLV